MIAEHRSDEQLESTLYETANWTVNGVHGVVLCEVASLRLAIEEAAQFAAMGREVVALVRRRSPEIVVLSGQIRKLANLLIEAHVSPGPHVKASINETTCGFGGDLSVLMPYDAACRDAAAANAVHRK